MFRFLRPAGFGKKEKFWQGLKRFLKVAFYASSATAVIVGGVSVYATRVINRQRPRLYTDDYVITPYELQIPYDEVIFHTKDEVELHGWFMKSLVPSNTVVIMLTGYNRSKADLVGMASWLWRDGHNVFLFDFRSRSKVQTAQTVGFLETRDATAALEYVKRRMPSEKTRIGLVGMSMGGAVSLILASRNSDAVKCVITDSAFAKLSDAVNMRLKRLYLPYPELLLRVIDCVNNLWYGYSFMQVRPVDAVKVYDQPVLFIHGSEDKIVPVSNARELYNASASKNKELWIQTNTHHCGVYFNNRPQYSKKLVDFLDKYLVDRTLDPDPSQTVQTITLKSEELQATLNQKQEPEGGGSDFDKSVGPDRVVDGSDTGNSSSDSCGPHNGIEADTDGEKTVDLESGKAPSEPMKGKLKRIVEKIRKPNKLEDVE